MMYRVYLFIFVHINVHFTPSILIHSFVIGLPAIQYLFFLFVIIVLFVFVYCSRNCTSSFRRGPMEINNNILSINVQLRLIFIIIYVVYVLHFPL